ncbi:MAG: TVP38/TMEM64 family protein [Candidatus Doudnabacteria bacterium]|nr:TVP38/TMEM64 family protein [Candidatus Doudnabacteria bacterium]
MTERQTKILDIVLAIILVGFLLWGGWSLYQGTAIFDLLLNNTDEFAVYLSEVGPMGNLVYTATIILEVLIAFIPGYVIYPIGGAVLGVGNAIFYSVIGNLIGASVSFWIGRKWGYPLLQKFVQKRHLDRWEQYVEKNGSLAVLFLKLNPITSFDVINYIAGASPMKFWKFTVFNLLGILPYIILTTIFGEGVFVIAPTMIIAFLVLTFLYILWFALTLPGKIRKTFGRK